MPRKTRTRRNKRKSGIVKKGYKKISSATKKIIPGIRTGVKAVGSVVTTVGKKTIPIVESGVSSIWNTFTKGTGMLFSGVNKSLKKISTRKRRAKRSKK